MNRLFGEFRRKLHASGNNTGRSMPANVSSAHADLSAAGKVYWPAVVLSGALMLYSLAWTAAVFAVLLWDARITIFRMDIYNAVQNANAFNVTLLAGIAAWMTAAFLLLLLRNRWAAAAASAGVAMHLVLWIRLIVNPYYTAIPGYVVLPMEIVLVALVLLLQQRKALR